MKEICFNFVLSLESICLYSSIGIVARLRAGRPKESGFISRQGQEFLLHTIQALGSTQPPIQLVPRTLSLGVKAAGTWS
jgi:hypothetical protein